jgi:ABC-2 type transport system permease protein
MTIAAPRPSWRQWHGYAPLDGGPRSRFAAASGDLIEGLRRWRLWSFLAVDNIRNQYRRTIIGPWWLTLQNVLYIAGLAVLFSAILDRPLREFLPYVGIGYTVFFLIAGLTRRGAEIFVSSAGSMGSNRQPLSFLVLRAAAIEVLEFGHSTVIILVFGLAGLLVLGPVSLLALPALALCIANGIAVAFWLGPTVARFRDVDPLVTSILRMLTFFTPIFWSVDSLRGQQRAALLEWNPLWYLMESVRSPLLGMPLQQVFTGAAIITVANLTLAVVVFSATRSRLPYWVA